MPAQRTAVAAIALGSGLLATRAFVPGLQATSAGELVESQAFRGASASASASTVASGADEGSRAMVGFGAAMALAATATSRRRAHTALRAEPITATATAAAAAAAAAKASAATGATKTVHGPMTVSGDQIKLEIRPEIFAQYPTAKVNVLTCAVSISDLKKKSDPATKALSTFKQETADMLANVHKISGANWEEQPVVKEWQTVFANFGKTIEAEQAFAAEKGLPTIQSTIVNAVKRASVQADNVKNGKKADMGKISSFVDMYNNVSLQNLVPMGAYAADKIAGNTIDLRFGKDGESFAPLMSAKEREAGIKASFDVKDGQVVYADEAGILTWLWNYRDADRTEVPYKSEEPVKIILMADAADSSDGKERGLKAIEQATALIEGALGGKVFGNWELSAQNPSAVLSFQK